MQMAIFKNKSHIACILMLIICMIGSGTMLSFAASDTDQNAALTIDQSFQIIGTKPADLDTTCEYTLTAVTADAPLPDGATGSSYTFKLSGDDKDSDSITFTADAGSASGDHLLKFTRAGVYEYTLTPPAATAAGATEGYTFQGTKYNIRVYVENSNGGLIVRTMLAIDSEQDDPDDPDIDSKKVSAVHYVHKYEGDFVPCSIDPPVKKKITGDTPAKDATFHFTMTADPDDSILPDGMSKMPMPNGISEQSYTMTIKGEGEREFGVIEFDQVGKYVYKVTEDNDKVNGYGYDKAVYTVIAEVTEDANKNLVVKTTYKKNKFVSDEIVFKNAYSKDGGKSRTGDEIRMMVLIGAFAAAGLVLILFAIGRFRRKDESA